MEIESFVWKSQIISAVHDQRCDIEGRVCYKPSTGSSTRALGYIYKSMWNVEFSNRPSCEFLPCSDSFLERFSCKLWNKQQGRALTRHDVRLWAAPLNHRASHFLSVTFPHIPPSLILLSWLSPRHRQTYVQRRNLLPVHLCMDFSLVCTPTILSLIAVIRPAPFKPATSCW